MAREGLGGGRRGRAPVDPEAVALGALALIAGDPERAERFMALSGLGPGDLRGAAADPGFLCGVLDHVVADEPLLLLVAAAAGLAPEDVVAAQRRLAGPAPEEG